MKKIILIVSLFLAIALLSFSESKAQCASGFSSTTITLNIGGCNYDVELCYKCAVSYPGEAYVRRIIKHPTIPPCVNSMDAEDVINYVYNYVNTGEFILTVPCLGFGVPPCNEAPYFSLVRVFFPFCWKVENDIHYFNQPVVAQVPCDIDNYCEITLQVCMDDNNLNTLVYYYETHGDIPDCPEFEMQHQYECFIYHTVCNP